MSAHGGDFKLSDEFFAGIRTAAAIEKAKGGIMTDRAEHTPKSAGRILHDAERLAAYPALESENARLRGRVQELEDALAYYAELPGESAIARVVLAKGMTSAEIDAAMLEALKP